MVSTPPPTVAPRRPVHSVTVAAAEQVTPNMRRLTFAGEALTAMAVLLPAQWLKVRSRAPARALRPHRRRGRPSHNHQVQRCGSPARPSMPSGRRQGLARHLYRDLFARAREEGHDVICCEVNRDPPYPASDRFHDALGFELEGEAIIPSGNTVRYLSLRLMDPSCSRSRSAPSAAS